jgi:hypothetical protein
MKELSEYITEYVSSGRGKKPSFPKDLKDIKKVTEFLETKGFSDASQRTNTESMPDILSAFKKSNEPVYIYNEYHTNGEYSYWLRFFYTEKPTRNITEENPIFTVSFNPSFHSSDPNTYFIEKTVGDTIKQITRDEFMELLKSHFGWG